VGHDTYYDILGVSPTATQDEIRTRYRTVIRRIHPDLDVPAALFRQVQEAYEVLSDPPRRATYDRWLASGGVTVRRTVGGPRDNRVRGPSDPGRPRHPGATSAGRRPRSTDRRRKLPGTPVAAPRPVLQPQWPLAMTGAALILLGSALGAPGTALILLGSLAVIVAGVVGLGVRGEKEREAYQRSGMAAVDAMTGRQFEILLKNFFASKGSWVARIGGREALGALLLLSDANGRTVVHAGRWNDVVDQDAVEQAVAAMSRYRAVRGLVVTPSDYSEQAVAVANSRGVTLWNRSILATELTAFRGQPPKSGARLSGELRAGARLCLGFVLAVFVALAAMGARARAESTESATDQV
jgi:hypothetical protein